MKSLIFTLVFFMMCFSVNAQENTKKNSKQSKEEKREAQIKKVKELIDNKAFVFSARQAVPLCGDPVCLEYFYSLKISDGVARSYLPFYGFESDYNIENSPLDFAKSYEEFSVKKENNIYIINFSIPDDNNNMQFYLNISELGYTYLKIISEQRQSISFRGIIEEIEPAVFSSF